MSNNSIGGMDLRRFEMKYQKRYWAQLSALKTHIIYLQYYGSRSDLIDKIVNIALAITSSASIAAWAVWKDHQAIWATIIAGSQVITAVRPFLPYKQRAKLVTSLCSALEPIALESERHWFYVAEGLYTEEQIHDKYIELSQRMIEAEEKCFAGNIVPHSKCLLQKAEIEADRYLSSHYYGEQQ